MKLPSTDKLITASLPAAYFISVAITVAGLHPTNVGDAIVAIIAASYLSIYIFMYVWMGLLIGGFLLTLPILALRAAYRSLTEEEEESPTPPSAKRKRKQKTANEVEDQATQQASEQVDPQDP